MVGTSNYHALLADGRFGQRCNVRGLCEGNPVQTDSRYLFSRRRAAQTKRFANRKVCEWWTLETSGLFSEICRSDPTDLPPGRPTGAQFMVSTREKRQPSGV